MDTVNRGMEQLLEERVGPWGVAGWVQVQVIHLAKFRARQDLSHAQYEQALAELRTDVQSSPESIELLLQFAASDAYLPSFANAVLEAAGFLVQYTGRPALVQMVKDALSATDAAGLIALATKQERQGRPDLAAVAWHNVAVSYLHSGKTSNAVDSLARAWEILSDISNGREYVPRTAVFECARAYLQIGATYARTSLLNHDHDRALLIADAALSKAGQRQSVRGNRSDDGGAEELWFDLQGIAVSALGELGQLAAADERAAFLACEADAAGADLTSATARLQRSVVVSRTGDADGAHRHLVSARDYADQHRRHLPYELDKVRAAERLQAIYLWAGEDLIKGGQHLEALSALEGLRSRALLDILGLSEAITPPPSVPEAVRDVGERLLRRARSIAYPGDGGDQLGLLEHWRAAVGDLDAWITEMQPYAPEYAAIVRGSTMRPNEIRSWAAGVARPTAIVWWFLGDSYSYQAVLLARPCSEPVVRFARVSATLQFLAQQAQILHEAVRQRQDPPDAVLRDLSDELLGPVRDELLASEAVYLCPSQSLHSVPLAALLVDGEPLNAIRDVSMVPSLSVLRALCYADRCSQASTGAFVFGPELPSQAARVAALLKTTPQSQLFTDDHRPIQGAAACATLHLICHGFHDEFDPWNSGFAFPRPAKDRDILSGRDLLCWRLQTRLAVLEACDTRRQAVSVTDDCFGLGRFLHYAGVPSLLVADWEVRSDVSALFMSAFHESLGRSIERLGRFAGRGLAYRDGIRAARDWAGHSHAFLWAPFVLLGVLD